MSFRDVLRIDVMRRVWYAQVISLFGDFLALFAVIVVVSFTMHGTPNQITGVQIFYMLPIVFVGPIAGVFVDRWPLKPTLVASDLIRAVLAMLLIPATSIWHVYVVLAALSCVSAFFGPAQQVTIRAHVPAPGLMSANALMQMAFMGMRVVGPATAGAIAASFGPRTCYAIDVASFIVSAALIGSVAIRRAPSAQAPAASSSNRIHAIWRDMVQGVNFIFHHAAIFFVVMAMAAGLFTIGCFGPLIAIFVRDTLHGSARLFGFVSAMVGVGLLIGTHVIRKLAARTTDDVLVLSGLAGIGAGVFLLGAVPHRVATLIAAVAIGFAFAAIMVPAQTLLQRETPHEMIGRVSSTNISVAFLAQIIGLVLSGVLADAFGVRMVFILCAGLAMAMAAGGRVFLHGSRSAKALEDVKKSRQRKGR
ncbi:MAG: MFS transporter [Acidobacteria bacterium 13_1_40CM_4_65_8]|nr:MAG: MFS transporter [Acidobacteria bacterium 13_1_40CM_4_65_8]